MNQTTITPTEVYGLLTQVHSLQYQMFCLLWVVVILLCVIIISKFWIYGKILTQIRDGAVLLEITKQYAATAQRNQTKADVTLGKIEESVKQDSSPNLLGKGS